ncbi:MAG: mechanosensitive ion channel family protein [Gammaproteobacteria bacterium]|nr:mechanosensitive ion channel family protein [Gammaproteobacteria bacterium]
MDLFNNAQLQNFLHLFSDNPYYQACIVLLLGLILAKLINHLMANVVMKIAQQTRSHLDNQVILITRPTLFYSILLIALAIATHIVATAATEALVFSLLKTIAVFIWTVFFIRMARVILKAISLNPNQIPVVSTQTLPLFLNLAILVIIGAAVYFLFSAWNIDMTAWLASAGIVGIAVGFAAKDTLANLFSGVFILADAPYKIGDYVVLDSTERGEVTHIGLRSTRLLTRDDVEVTVPNSIMGNTKVINESGGPHKKFRIRTKVGVAYGSDIDRVKALLMEIALDDADVCKDPEPRVRFRQFGASSLDLELLCWVEEPMLRGRIIDQLNTKIYKSFMQAGIEIPYSKHDIFIKEMPR